MKKVLLAFLGIILWWSLFPGFAQAQTEIGQVKEGKVIQVLESGQKTFLDDLVDFQTLEIEVTKGDQPGQTIEVENSAAGMDLSSATYKAYQPGDLLRISTQKDADGNTIYALDGQVRRNGLLSLVFLFVLVVLVVGRFWGAMSLVGLVTSFLVIFKIVVPMIVAGKDPVLAAVLGSFFIIPTTFYISHGFNTKTHVAVITTVISLILTGLLAVYFMNATYLTGFASEEAGYIQVERQGTIDIKGLLLAGIIIGALGILDDVTIGQSSAVRQLHEVDQKLSWWELFVKGMKVGQDHISSMVNTLILVYAGSSLPLLLLFFDSEKTFGDILEFELIAEEIVRMLIGSIGLVLAAPMATLLAAYWYTRKTKKSV